MTERCSDWLSVWCIWLYVGVMLCTSSRKNSPSIAALMSRNSLLEASLNNCKWIRPQNHLVRKRTLNRLAKLAKLLGCVLRTFLNGPSDWAVLWVLISTVHLIVCSCHVTYAFQCESTLYNWLNVKEFFSRRRREMWSLSDSNWTRT